MARALLINSATDIGIPTIPNYYEGWGRVNLGTLFDPSDQRVYLDQSVVLDEVGQAHTLQVAPADSSKPLKVTVVWTDAPGSAGAKPALVNDLDLTVVGADGTTYLGNRFNKGWSVNEGQPDRLNNMENVFIRWPSETYTVKISAFNLPGDGLP
jgi:hypothetical protein